jgi:Uma2 family endonuclease
MTMPTGRGHPPSVLRGHQEGSVPLHFPVEEEVPEGRRHMKLRTQLFQILDLELRDRGSVGSDQFVYWNARNPGIRLAPDVFLALGIPDEDFSCWKTWERKTPELAVEIVSPSDTPEGPWREKLDRYQALGVRELVRFDAEAPPGERLRIWDRVDKTLVEREIEGDHGQSAVIGIWWVVVEDEALGPALRPARDPDGRELLPTPTELESQARQAAEHRIAELLTELERHRR